MNTPAPVILIVDDEAQNRKLLEALLQPEGYVTRSVATGKEALSSVAWSRPDLILLDVMMPGMNGYEVARLLKADPITSNIPIIMVTALIDRGARLAGLTAGAEDFLTKPVDRAELWLRVRNLLRLKAYADFLLNYSTILEQQVQERSADLLRFRAAMDTTADAIMLVSRTTMRFVEMNATTCTMFGYTREELFRSGPSRLNDDDGGPLELLYDEVIAGQHAKDFTESVLRRKDGTHMQVEVHRHAHLSGADWIIVVVMRDITERKEAEKRLHHLAHYDALTTLPNRTLFYETLTKTLERAADAGWQIAVLSIDIDNFKTVNDSLGHAIGDELLCQFGDRLVECVRIRDTVGRLSGDEFALILVMDDGQQGATVVAGKIHDAVRVPFLLKGHEVSISVSIGIALHPADDSGAEILLKYADTAMYRAKQAGRDTSRFFTAQMNDEAVARLDMETALRTAVEAGEFVLYYQPKVNLDSGRIAGLEALIRWQRPAHGLVPPKDFIPILEETGLIVRVGSWVIATVCRQIAAWSDAGIGPIPISVNVSGRQFIEGDLESDVTRALRDTGIAADLLELELTEGSLMAHTGRTIASMQALKNLGVQISIDDFGTGYSSLAYLRRFPLDKLKIDIAFVRDITSNPDDAAIALAIIRMAHSLKLEVIAEGVETAAQLAYLRRHHCDLIQGYYFSPPLPMADIEAMMRDDKRLEPPPGEALVPLKTLMLVDDDADMLAALQRLLRQDGYKILMAQSAREGFELLALQPVQVILCDQRMPDMGGTVFLERVKHLYPDTLRIILSGYADLESIMEAINRGAIHRFCTKPLNSLVLRENVREAFRHHALLQDGKLRDEQLAGGIA